MTKNTNKDTITLNILDFEDLLIYSERYAIGRMTYATSAVCDMINSNLDNLSQNTLIVLKRDIENERDGNNLGNPNIDAPVWLKTLDNIKQKITEKV